MSVFNSLGSNYNLNFVFKSLFNFSSTEDKPWDFFSSKNKERLEKLLENKYQGKAVLLYKGREAIELALKILDLPKDSFVAINGFTCFAVYEAIKNANLQVEYLDIEKAGLNFSADTLKKAIKENPKIKVAIVQNTLGFPCQIEEIIRVCKDEKIILIEDLAHCVGTKYADGAEAGTVGDMVVLSFSQDKMIDGISGGALIIKNKTSLLLRNRNLNTNLDYANLESPVQLKDRLYPLFTYLIRKTYSFKVGKILHTILRSLNLLPKPVEGVNSNVLHKLPNFYCKLIQSAFENLDINLTHRKNIAQIYSQKINPKIMSQNLVSQIEKSANLRFPIFVNNRENLIEYMKKFNVYISDIWYDAPIAPEKYLHLTDYQNQCPNAELAASEIVNLPTHINVSRQDAERISNLVNQWLKSQ